MSWAVFQGLPLFVLVLAAIIVTKGVQTVSQSRVSPATEKREASGVIGAIGGIDELAKQVRTA